MVTTTSDFSTIEELNAAIQNHNPFNSAAVDNVQSVWGKGFPDLQALNAHAFQKVLDVIKQVQRSQNSQDKLATLVVTGDPGAGKTQLTARLRRRVMSDSTALFIYANAGKSSDLKLINYQFLQTLVRELGRVGSEGVSQWQQVATAMFNASNPKAYPAATLVKKFDDVYASYQKKNQNLVKKLGSRILNTKPNTDPYILRGILWTLSKTYAPYAVEWLAGNELDRETAQVMGLPTNANSTAHEKEAEALDSIKQILRLVSDYKTVLICFDEFDNVVHDTGETLAQVVAQFIKNLFDSLELSSFGQGAVILSVMFEATWQQQLVKYFSSTNGGTGNGVVDRLSTATKGQSIALNPLDSQSIVDLVALWLGEKVYEPLNLKPHDPVYPFSESELRKIGTGRPTVREVLDWCAKNYSVLDPDIAPEQRFELALQEAKKADLGDYLENNAALANAVIFGFNLLKGQAIEGVTSSGEKLKKVIVESVDTDVKPVSPNIEPKGLANSDWIFKVNGTENNKEFRIGIAVIQQSNAASVGAGLKRLTAYERFGLTRGCLVRSKDKKVSKTSQAYKLLEKLTKEMGGEWAYLVAEEIRPLIDIHTVYQQCENYNLTKEQVLDFANQVILDNPLLREILSDPSGEIDETTIDTEDEIQIAIFNEDSTDSLTDDDDLDELLQEN